MALVPSTAFSDMSVAIVAVPETKPQEKSLLTGDPAADLEAKLRWINEKVPLDEGNVMGSQAGAGSGDFHQYRMARRREEFRWARIEKEDQERKEREGFEERKKKRIEETEAKTEKNRAKRQKRKDKQKGKKGGAADAAAGATQQGTGGGAPPPSEEEEPEEDSYRNQADLD